MTFNRIVKLVLYFSATLVCRRGEQLNEFRYWLFVQSTGIPRPDDGQLRELTVEKLAVRTGGTVRSQGAMSDQRAGQAGGEP